MTAKDLGMARYLNKVALNPPALNRVSGDWAAAPATRMAAVPVQLECMAPMDQAVLAARLASIRKVLANRVARSAP